MTPSINESAVGLLKQTVDGLGKVHGHIETRAEIVEDDRTLRPKNGWRALFQLGKSSFPRFITRRSARWLAESRKTMAARIQERRRRRRRERISAWLE